MDAKLRCPGSFRSMQPTPAEKVCHRCGRMLEIWSDEEVVHCKCGAAVLRSGTTPKCVEWCSAAEQCLGDVLDVKKIQTEARARAGKEENVHFVETTCKTIRAARRQKKS